MKVCFLFEDKEKFFKLQTLTFEDVNLVSFTADRSACAFLSCDLVSNLFEEFSGNLHFTHYTQGKYVIERKFMYL